MKNKKHLFTISKKDFTITFFSGKGAGGQHRNKHQNCVRMYHKDSGASSTGQSYKERQSNIREAFNSLTTNVKFKIWLNRKIQETLEGKNIEEKVEEQLAITENLKIEIKNDKGRWVELKED